MNKLFTPRNIILLVLIICCIGGCFKQCSNDRKVNAEAPDKIKTLPKLSTQVWKLNGYPGGDMASVKNAISRWQGVFWGIPPKLIKKSQPATNFYGKTMKIIITFVAYKISTNNYGCIKAHSRPHHPRPARPCAYLQGAADDNRGG